MSSLTESLRENIVSTVIGTALLTGIAGYVVGYAVSKWVHTPTVTFTHDYNGDGLKDFVIHGRLDEMCVMYGASEKSSDYLTGEELSDKMNYAWQKDLQRRGETSPIKKKFALRSGWYNRMSR